ncbi:aldose 1-epimerase isoform X1 [Syngnathoides biaculeatus]|uniref:aldose 1-epimerase isoform X1 n=1 Tax=Syngnathoides biaculeatus TaxID=300417 RepID=UPI002ADE1356|nr:aldose 1-epimerase isoform X1 [Syngnathoides biaculeatus]
MTAMIGCRTPATFIRISGSENGWMFKNLLSQAIWIPTAVEGGVKMCLSSPDGDQGYPGEMQVSVTYTLQEKTLAVEYEARCSKTTPVNLTNHSYFNLGGQGNLESPINARFWDVGGNQSTRRKPTQAWGEHGNSTQAGRGFDPQSSEL